MNKETKNEAKKTAATGASTAAGAAAGVVIGVAITPDTVEAMEVEPPRPAPKPEPRPKPEPTPVEPEPEPQPQPEPPSPTPTPNPEPPTPEPEVKVISYDRVTNDDGSRMDIAVVNVNGNEVALLDVDLDGIADLCACDYNQNGVIEDNEVELVHDLEIEMRPLGDAVGFNPLYAQNDIPDYVNDADVENYLA